MHQTAHAYGQGSIRVWPSTQGPFLGVVAVGGGAVANHFKSIPGMANSFFRVPWRKEVGSKDANLNAN